MVYVFYSLQFLIRPPSSKLTCKKRSNFKAKFILAGARLAKQWFQQIL